MINIYFFNMLSIICLFFGKNIDYCKFESYFLIFYENILYCYKVYGLYLRRVLYKIIKSI